MALKISDTDSDSKLVLFVRENNDEAKDKLYEKYSPLIHKEINRVKKVAYALGIDMADLSQEAMLAFSHAINNYKEDSEVKFITFATLCIRRKLSSFISKYETVKSKAMNTHLSLDLELDEKNKLVELLHASNMSDPLNKLINGETLKEVDRNIKEKLSDNERAVLRYDLMGKSTSEIASELGMTSKQVYNLIYRARNKLKL